jgi:hypothetical protein
MIFLGDIASPDEKCSNDLLKSMKLCKHLFEDKCVVANLEGLLADTYAHTNKPVLSNHPSVLKPLSFINTRAVTLANNHTLDLPGQMQTTIESLKKNGIAFCGAGKTWKDAETPANITHDGMDYLIIGCSWDVMMQHQTNRQGVMTVNPIQPNKLLSQIKRLRESHSRSKIVIKIHWNFDLETIPFPSHRSLAKAMIDSGANAVIGCHSHCVQGGERYKDGVIIYGLGNFYFPWYVFTGGESFFPDWTRTELAFEWDANDNSGTCHWFKYNYTEQNHELEYVKSEDFDDGLKINEYSPYRNMESEEYVNWYKKNRRKNFLIPVYRDHREVWRNTMIDFYLKKRIKFARFLAKKKLMGWHK